MCDGWSVVRGAVIREICVAGKSTSLLIGLKDQGRPQLTQPGKPAQIEAEMASSSTA